MKTHLKVKPKDEIQLACGKDTKYNSTWFKEDVTCKTCEKTYAYIYQSSPSIVLNISKGEK